ncbi:hypothetical protein BLL40_16170 [Domibacillus mangrovi]|uniref:Tc1-like transposase DDE domain-containing protein n=1 Tax=Domibacillus mangrovi TaxID=1714354 RepID=A0A1Q5NZ51_9BACI|nr:hypothetical protein BLL40_16170 [Domibacillus mangrovi]
MNREQAINELKEAMKKAQGRRDFERYQAVLLFLEGYQKKEIAQIIGHCSHSIGLIRYPTGQIVMILDNARIHHAKLIQPFLETNRGCLKLIFLPPYSPYLNLIEGWWKYKE